MLANLLPAAVFLLNSLVIEWLRPASQSSSSSWLSFVLGWLPNSLAGFGFVLMGYFLAQFVQDLKPDPKRLKLIRPFVGAVALVSALVLTGWELAQISGNLVFDPHDIVASIAGVAFGRIAFEVLFWSLNRSPAGARVARNRASS